MITDFDGSGPLKVTIGSLPDEVLLEVFTFYMEDAYQEEWIILVHVCGGWRHIVFTSPLRLDLQLCVQGKTHVRKLLEIWPALPIVIRPNSRRWCSIPKVMENVIAALQHRDCVRRVILHDFRVPDRKLKVFLELMQHPFPTLTMLELWKWSNKSFQIHSWVDLLHCYNHSHYLTLHFRGYRNFFCPPITWSSSTLGIFLLPGTFPLK